MTTLNASTMQIILLQFLSFRCDGEGDKVTILVTNVEVEFLASGQLAWRNSSDLDVMQSSQVGYRLHLCCQMELGKGAL